MARITASVLTSGSSETDAAEYATASISPDAGVLLVAVVGAVTSLGQEPNPNGVTGLNLTWSLVDDAQTPLGIGVAVFAAYSGSAPGSGALTATFAQTQLRSLWHVVSFAAAVRVRQGTAEIGSGVTSSQVDLGAFRHADCGTFGAVLHSNTNDTVVGSGFTELADTTIGAVRLQSEWRNDNDQSVTASWTTAASYAAVGGELLIGEETWGVPMADWGAA